MMIALLTGLSITTAVRAQDDALPDSVGQPYLAYETAMASQDYAAALQHAEDAWRAADRAEIDRELTGILAGNYGHLAQALENPAAAYEGWRAAAEIADEINAPAADRVNNWHQAAMSAFQDGDSSDALRCSANATEVLDRSGSDGMPTNLLDGHYYLAANLNYAASRYEESSRLARRAIELRDRRGAETGRTYADLHYLLGLAVLADHEWDNAFYHLAVARWVYEALEVTDREQISDAMVSWLPLHLDDDIHWQLFMRLYEAGMPPEDRSEIDEASGVEFIAFKPQPQYPENWQEERPSGMLAVSYDISDSGLAEDVVVESNTVSPELEANLLERMQSWRFAAIEGGSELSRLGRQTEAYEYAEGGLQIDSEGPRPLVRVEPRYPSRAFRNLKEGVAVVRFDVADDGSVENVETVVDLPPGYFATESENAVLRWRYTPLREGEAREDRQGVLTQFVFRLVVDEPED